MPLTPLRPSFLSFALLAASCAPAMGAEAAWLGEADCRVAPLEPAPSRGVSWNGQCIDGYASGKGVLAWRSAQGDRYSIDAAFVRGAASGEAVLKTPDYTYTGTLANGLPHGQGYFEYANDKGWYEGEVAAGKPHGQGIRLKVDRSRYTGAWVRGERNGWGEATFTTGGSYTGNWKDDKFDGQGKIVYAGSGRSYEGLFEDGRVAGLPAMEVASGRYAIKESVAGSHIREDRVVAYLPLKSAWDQLTPAQKNTVRSNYPALEAGDDPPFPVNGEHPLLDVVRRINQKLGVVSGFLGVHVLVGKDGKALKVTTYGSPSPEMVRAMSQLMVLQEYKPALCRGEPCDMVYPVHFNFMVKK
jgi:hypothetical protein